ncbi:hypothetical protein DFQ30_008215 [Apophysomyces sp. BC1015]|nr:hypothetical protein DFQ30_008215 [Apophysomyces sp. BC1015]
MNESNLSLSTSQRLQPFLLLSKAVKGTANSKLILDALAAPGVYVFSELYEAPNVVETLSYDVLQKYLDIANVRVLEDLVIDAFYQGILVGKLDQRQRQLQVDYAMGRDLRPGQMDETMARLKQWSTNTHALLGALDDKIQSIQESTAASKNEREEYERKLEQLRKEIQSKKNADDDQKKGRADMEDCRYESVEYNMERGGGRAKKRY